MHSALKVAISRQYCRRHNVYKQLKRYSLSCYRLLIILHVTTANCRRVPSASSSVRDDCSPNNLTHIRFMPINSCSLYLCCLHEMVARVTIVCNRFRNVFMKLARIAYARGASIAHYTKPLLIHVLRQTAASIHRSLNEES